MVTEKKHFKIVENEALSQETIEKVIKEYTETSNSKRSAAISASKKLGVPRSLCINILKETPNKSRKFVKKTRPVRAAFEEIGGLEVVKALRHEGYSIAQIAKYLNIYPERIYEYIKEEGWTLKRKTALTNEEVERIKKEHGLV